MKIAIAQTRSVKGDLRKNIANHLQLLGGAVGAGVDVVIFPELSITGYEPTLAKALAVDKADGIFSPFQQIADTKELVVIIGVPLIAVNGITISLLIFQPHQERLVYSKRNLHPDEFPYFTKGDDQPLLIVKGERIGLGICYETLQRAHFENAAAHKATIFLASVAKPAGGLEKAYVHFPAMARAFGMSILMANSVGFQDDFLAHGQSSIWNEQGELIGQLDEESQGLLIFDTQQGTASNITQLDNQVFKPTKN